MSKLLNDMQSVYERVKTLENTVLIIIKITEGSVKGTYAYDINFAAKQALKECEGL